MEEQSVPTPRRGGVLENAQCPRVFLAVQSVPIPGKGGAVGSAKFPHARKEVFLVVRSVLMQRKVGGFGNAKCSHVLIVQSKPPSMDAHVQVKAKWGVGTSPTHQHQQDDIIAMGLRMGGSSRVPQRGKPYRLNQQSQHALAIEQTVVRTEHTHDLKMCSQCGWSIQNNEHVCEIPPPELLEPASKCWYVPVCTSMRAFRRDERLLSNEQ